MEKLHAVPMPPEPVSSPWDQWGRLTRFFESARLAFAREQNLWASSGIGDPRQVRITAPEGRYNVTVSQHIDALNDAEPLYATVLVYSYGVVESAAAERLATPQRALGPIEEWGTRLLATNDRAWTHVTGGLPGAVEVAVVRNAFAHGSRLIDVKARERLLRGGAPTRLADSTVTLTHDELHAFRARLRSLLNESGFGRPPS